MNSSEIAGAITRMQDMLTTLTERLVTIEQASKATLATLNASQFYVAREAAAGLKFAAWPASSRAKVVWTGRIRQATGFREYESAALAAAAMRRPDTVVLRVLV